MPVIEAHKLVAEHSPGRGVCGVTFGVEQGQCFALLGRNGSGKSTLTRALLGLEEADAGTLAAFGRPVTQGSRHHLDRLGVALDTSVHWDALSGWDNARFVALSYGMGRREARGRLERLFELADLWAQRDEPASTYSFGMRRKLSLIEALCHDPQLLVLDEPTAGLDEHFLLALSALVRQRTEAGRTTWVAGNDADWIAGVATRVAFMDGGRFAAQGTVEELVAEVSPLTEVCVTLAAVRPIAAPALDGLRSFRQEGRELTALGEPDAALVPRLVDHVVAQGGQVAAVEVRHTTLREAFLLKTGRTLTP